MIDLSSFSGLCRQSREVNLSQCKSLRAWTFFFNHRQLYLLWVLVFIALVLLAQLWIFWMHTHPTLIHMHITYIAGSILCCSYVYMCSDDYLGLDHLRRSSVVKISYCSCREPKFNMHIGELTTVYKSSPKGGGFWHPWTLQVHALTHNM